MDERERIDVVWHRRVHTLRNIGAALAVVACAATFPSMGGMGMLWFVGVGMTGLIMALFSGDGTLRRIDAFVDAEGVHAGGRLVAPRRDLRSGWIERDGDAIRVHLCLGEFRGLDLEASDAAQARAQLERLGLDPSQSVVTFPTGARIAIALWAGLGGQLLAHGLVGGGHKASFVLPFLSWVALVAVITVLLRDQTSVGSDGVFFRRFFRERFIPFREIESAFAEDLGRLVIQTRSAGAFVRHMRPAAAAAAAEIIESAVAAVEGGPDPVRETLRLEALAGQGGGAGAWLARLRTLATPASYRGSGLGGDALWRVVSDPAASGSERVAAAVVLRGTPGARERLLKATARIASPRVRVALERVADPTDEDELALAVAALAAIDDSHGS